MAKSKWLDIDGAQIKPGDIVRLSSWSKERGGGGCVVDRVTASHLVIVSASYSIPYPLAFEWQKRNDNDN